jgi:hypothetical protein
MDNRLLVQESQRVGNLTLKPQKEEGDRRRKKEKEGEVETGKKTSK